MAVTDKTFQALIPKGWSPEGRSGKEKCHLHWGWSSLVHETRFLLLMVQYIEQHSNPHPLVYGITVKPPFHVIICRQKLHLATHTPLQDYWLRSFCMDRSQIWQPWVQCILTTARILPSTLPDDYQSHFHTLLLPSLWTFCLYSPPSDYMHGWHCY